MFPITQVPCIKHKCLITKDKFEVIIQQITIYNLRVYTLSFRFYNKSQIKTLIGMFYRLRHDASVYTTLPNRRDLNKSISSKQFNRSLTRSIR